MTLTLHTWMIPAAVTVCLLFGAWGIVRFDKNYKPGELWNGVFYFIFGGVAVLFSVIAWLVWVLA